MFISSSDPGEEIKPALPIGFFIAHNVAAAVATAKDDSAWFILVKRRGEFYFHCAVVGKSPFQHAVVLIRHVWVLGLRGSIRGVIRLQR